MIKRLFCLCLALLLTLGITCSCKGNGKNKYSTYSMDYFDTVVTITGYEKSQADFDKQADKILNMLGEYHRLYDIYHRFDGLENLCTINELVDGVHRTVTVDKRIIDMLLFAKEMYTATNGTVNVAMGSVLYLWHNYRAIGMDNPSEASLPPMDKLKEAAKHTNIDNLIIDTAASTVTLADPQMRLDVGAVAKGYATECVAKALENEGVTGYVLNVGGNVRTIGCKADGDKWTVGIENPDGGDYLAYLSLAGETVVTSGSYQRFYYVDGEAYHHIIDPDTLMPSKKGFLSVSIVCRDSGKADALSTALFCLSQQEGSELIKTMPDVEAIWVTEDGKKLYSDNWDKYKN